MKLIYNNYSIEIKRECAGFYKISLGEYSCNVEHFKWDNSTGWLVIANWDRHLYSDPIDTYATAKITAFELLIKFHENWILEKTRLF